MNKENLQLKNQEIKPTREVLEQVLGNSYDVYQEFQDELGKLDIEQNLQWYTPHKIWCGKGQYFWITSRETRKEKNIYWLHVFDGYFSVTVWFLEKNREILLMSDLGDDTQQIIRDAIRYGKLATFPVMIKLSNRKYLNDIYQLINLKKKLET